ncbi:hypothetical protein N2152v2_010901 [Parachlorella kessleri]
MATTKVYFVTGASRGIGLSLVTSLVGKGQTVIATARDPDNASQLKDLASQHAGRLHIVKLDVNQPSTFVSTTDQIKKAGFPHLDVVINNAGVLGEVKPLGEVTEQVLRDVYQTNTIGPFLLTQELKKTGLIGQPGTVIVNITSVLGSIGANIFPGWTGFEYRASKAALNILTKHLDTALAKDNVAVVAIHPGYVMTEMNKGDGHITVEESVKGILSVLESGKDLHGTFYNYDGQPLPW